VAWFQRQSFEVRLIIGVGVPVLVAAAVAVVIVLNSGSSLSGGAPCADFVKSSPGERSSYMASKLEAAGHLNPSKAELAEYAEGFRLNCSKGYPNSTVEREAEGTISEVEEAEGEGEDLGEAIEWIAERTQEREDYGWLCEEELEEPC
jgi:hypothetical protein